MDRLVFTAHMAQSEQRLDRMSLTHELANVSTPGFKRAYEVANRSVRVEGDGFDSRFLPRAFTTNRVDLTEGPRLVTGRQLDVAMNADTVMAVQADNGDLAWTRRGDLSINSNGFLVTGEQHLVLDDAGLPISMPQGAFQYQISSDGVIHVSDPAAPELGSQIVASLGLKDASSTPLARREDGLFQPIEGLPEVPLDFESGDQIPSVASGALEGSNVSSVKTLVRFIDHMRSFEMQTRVIKETKDNDASGIAMMRLS